MFNCLKCLNRCFLQTSRSRTKAGLYRAQSFWENFPEPLSALGHRAFNKHDQLYKLAPKGGTAAPVGACYPSDTFVNLQLSSAGPKYNTWGSSAKREPTYASLYSPTAFLPAHVCCSTRSGFHHFCFRCNNLILVSGSGEVGAADSTGWISAACIFS